MEKQILEISKQLYGVVGVVDFIKSLFLAFLGSSISLIITLIVLNEKTRRGVTKQLSEIQQQDIERSKKIDLILTACEKCRDYLKIQP